MIDNLYEIYKNIKNRCEEIETLCRNNRFFIFSCDENGDTLLHYATLDSDYETIRKLVELGACPNLRNLQYMSPMSYVASGDSLEALKYLVEVSTCGLVEEEFSEILVNAAIGGKIENVEYLLKAGFNPNATLRKDPIIYWAGQSSSLSIVKLLYDYGADINATSEDGATLLYDVSSEGDTDIVEFLIENGADIDKATNDGVTPLIISCGFNKIESVKLLLDNGSDIEKKNQKGCTALLSAIYHGNVEIVKLLLSRGANKTAKDEKGKGAKEYCKHIKSQKIRQEIIKILDLS